MVRACLLHDLTIELHPFTICFVILPTCISMQEPLTRQRDEYNRGSGTWTVYVLQFMKKGLRLYGMDITIRMVDLRNFRKCSVKELYLPCTT